MTGVGEPFRLLEGGEVDRLSPVTFTFDGKRYSGCLGDTLASALLANGVRLVGRSFKYHRPRGIYSAGPEEPNALVELRSGGRHEPNTRATMCELFAGLDARSQNRWPNLALDIMQINAIAAPILIAGFYYKTFMGLPGWHFYERFIRKSAGMGRGTYEPDPDRYDRIHAHCDVLVIGAGPTGLAAALSAGRSGARVMLLEDSDRPGGLLRSERATLDRDPAMTWVQRTVAELQDLDEVTLLTRTTGFGYYDGNVIAAIERIADHLPVPPPFTVRQRVWHIRARQIVFATGATERPLVFADNDRPGIMLASAARSYVNRFAVRPGRRAVIFANNDDAYRTAIDLAKAGIEIMVVADTRASGQGELKERAEALGITCLGGVAVTATHGYTGLSGVTIGPSSGSRTASATTFVSCDLLAVSGGWNPNIQLQCHNGVRPVYDPAIAAFVPGPSHPAQHTAGAASGKWGLAEALLQGAEAGAQAARNAGFEAIPVVIPAAREPETGPMQPCWQVPGPGKKFVDLQDDVTASDIALAHREGYISVEHLKRYTTLGMGTDQGRLGNVNGLAIMAEARGIAIPEAGVTTFRPPVSPVAMGALAGGDVGPHFVPTRRTALHDWHADNGAVFTEAGHWLRPHYYLRPGEADNLDSMDRAVAREVVATPQCRRAGSMSRHWARSISRARTPSSS